MNQAVVLCSLLAIAVASPSVLWSKLAPASDVDATNDVVVSDQRAQWAAYKTEHHKFYEGAEDERRFATFSHHLQVIEEHNSLYDQGKKSYKLGLNHFTDMTQAEFQFHYLGLKRDYKATLATSSSTFLKPFNLNEPDTVDWRQKGIVTGVKNQGQCGSCWSFSTTGSLEGQHAKKTGKLVSLSEQQLVDCSVKFGNHGCQGGLMDQAFEYIKAVGGIESEAEYPYEAEQEKKCHFHKREVNATVTGFHDVTSQDEAALKSAVASVGPVSIAIDAAHSSFQLYKEGVYDEPECSSTQLDHGVLVVGYGTEDGHDYWLVKNSWGEEWGDEGYIKMSRNKHNQCGVATSASFPLV